MSAPQPPVVVDAAAPVPMSQQPARSAGTVLAAWGTGGILWGMLIGAVAVAITYGAGAFFGFFFGLVVGAGVGGLAGLVAGGVLIASTRQYAEAVGYGPPARRPVSIWMAAAVAGVVLAGAVPVVAMIAGWSPGGAVASVGAALLSAVLTYYRARGEAVPVTRRSPTRPAEAVLLAGVAGAVVVIASLIAAPLTGFASPFGVGLPLVLGLIDGGLLIAGGVLARPREFAARTAVVTGPLLLLFALIFALIFVPTTLRSPVQQEPMPPPIGSPSDGSDPTDGSIPEEDPSRIPGSPPLYGESYDPTNLAGHLEEQARYSLEIAQVDDPDIPPGTAFPATFVQCPWNPATNQVQAATDIWFDTADDLAAITRVRDYWVSNGYTLVIDDPDLVVVFGAPGTVGAKFSIQTTWDDELRLRMESVCITN